MNKLLALLREKRPFEIYVVAALLYFGLFLNPSELVTTFVDFEDLFSIRDSIVFGLIRGMTDDNLGHDQERLLYWLLCVAYVATVALKASRISRWVWSDAQPSSRYGFPMQPANGDSENIEKPQNSLPLIIEGTLQGPKQTSLHATLSPSIPLGSGECTSYSQVPWYRRSSFNTAFILTGFITKGYLPLGLVTCVLVLTGDIYLKEKDERGKLKKWSKANKIAAVLFLVLNAGLLLYVLTVK